MNLGKKKIEKLIESQKGALEKFVTCNKQNITEKLGDSSTNENNSYDSQLKNNNESNPNASQSKDTNENIPNDSQNFNIPTFDEKHEKNLKANEYINETLDYIGF